ncbi:hypothetical protein [Cypionkella psychrotolerans]|uniref:hypothetical protein n=1 Tax=Cypionkella psychrotolerans TaxID=1678131 RepID=UPI000AF25141
MYWKVAVSACLCVSQQMNHTAGVFLFHSDGRFGGIIDFHEDRRFAVPKIRRILA